MPPIAPLVLITHFGSAALGFPHLFDLLGISDVVPILPPDCKGWIAKEVITVWEDHSRAIVEFNFKILKTKISKLK